MNIRKLSKSIQDYIVDGLDYIAVYKKGRSWDYEILDSDSYEELQNDQELKKLYAIDKNVIVVNGYYDNFFTNSLTDIEYKIKRNYKEGIGQIYYLSEFTNKNVEDEKITKKYSQELKAIVGVIEQLFENSGIEVTEAEFKDILQITTDDIRENRIKFGKKTSMEEMVTVAVRVYGVMKRVTFPDIPWPSVAGLSNANKAKVIRNRTNRGCSCIEGLGKFRRCGLDNNGELYLPDTGETFKDIDALTDKESKEFPKYA